MMLDKHYGILAGSVSMMGGLGTSAAFGPYFEQTYGITGGTAVAITAATFGMAAALMIGGPFGEWLIRRFKIKTAQPVAKPEPELRIPDDLDTDITGNHAAQEKTLTEELMKATAVIVLCMALGSVVSGILGQFVTLPAYIGSMIVAAVVRNVGDFTKKYTVEGKGLNALADMSLVLFVTMAINSLKLHELIDLALPLAVILAAPKSISFTESICLWAFPSLNVIMILSGLMSRWIIPDLCTCTRASRIGFMIFRVSSSVNLPPFSFR